MAEKSITVHVTMGSPYGVFILNGFTSYDTVRVLKERVVQRAMDLGLPPLCQENRSMTTRQGHLLEDDQTLASLSNSASDLMPISLCYFIGKSMYFDKEVNDYFCWLKICKRVRLNLEAHEANWNPHQVVDNKGDPVLILKRPKRIQGPLPFAQLTDLGINGQYELLNSNGKSICVSEIGIDTSVETSASVILLALSDEILNDLVVLNTESEYLIIRVSWDILSYFFLRTLRSSCPDIPIVAVTDLDPHHLDLLTFLDTPPENVLGCYGWDLSSEFDEVYDTETESVDIEWLGLRPSDCESLFSDGSTCPRPTPPNGFHEVIRMLRANPYLRMKEDWLAALHWLDEFGRSVTFHPLAPADPDDCHLHLGVDFIAKKLSKKDWV